MTSDTIGGDKADGNVIKRNISVSAETGSAVSVGGGDAVVGTQIKDVAGNVIIQHHVSDKDAARNQRIRQHLLDQLQATWIQGVLENSLYEVARLELGLESRPDAVERPWVMSLERPNQPPQTLPPTSKILDTFKTLNGAMLILGEPGSGKTITLLELARELRKVALADERQPVPLVFNLSSWAEKRLSLLDWLVGELSSQVYRVGRKHASDWLTTMPLHLLLDGLDEVSAEHRDACVVAINKFWKEHGPVNLVVCSRTAEYDQLIEKLHLMGAIVIQPLTQVQVNTYLSAIGQHLLHIVTGDEALQELAQTPLTLNIIALAYRDHPPDQLDAGTMAKKQHLFTAFINRMFERRTNLADDDKYQSIRYLAWLAGRMQDHEQSIYYIEKMQPSWLSQHKLSLSLINMLSGGSSSVLIGVLVLGIIGGLIGGLIGVVTNGLIGGVTFGFAGIIIGGLIGTISGVVGYIMSNVMNRILSFGQRFGLRKGIDGDPNRIDLVEKLEWSWSYGLLGLMIGGVIGVLFVGSSYWLSNNLITGLRNETSANLIIVLVFGLNGALLSGLRGKELQVKSIPNQGIRLSRRNALIVGLRSFFLGALIGGPIGWLIDGVNSGLSGILIGGISIGVNAGLMYGGYSFIKHSLLRLFLARYDYLPFNPVPFLDEMAERIILRKVGGGYIFIHRMLLEYFADLEGEV